VQVPTSARRHEGREAIQRLLEGRPGRGEAQAQMAFAALAEGRARREADAGRRQQVLGEGQAVADALDPDEGVERGLRRRQAEARDRGDAL
jgi:hypothetical protein